MHVIKLPSLQLNNELMDFSNRQLLKHFYYLLVMILLAHSCAKPMSPQGGPKDVDPPQILRTYPDNLSTNFTGKEIVLVFDEFIQLKDINSQLIISPPLRELPDFKIRGKSLNIKFKDDWKSETTYNIYFGDAIVDITENNSLAGYKFTFSTGSVLDSMKIEGKVINAFNLKPIKSAYVMLYDTIYDSVPYKQIPYYIARTNDNGEYSLTNLRNKPYLIFGLSDGNANYLYDLPTEEISFVDSTIMPWIEVARRKSGNNILSDTLDANQPLNDSVILTVFGNDSIAITDTLQTNLLQDTTLFNNDSIMTVGAAGKMIRMFHFREVDTIQDLLKSQLLRRNVVSLIFKRPVIQPIARIIDETWNMQPVIATNRTRDTLTVWLPEYQSDSILMLLYDSDQLIDSVEMPSKPNESLVRRRATTPEPQLNITSNVISGRLRPTSPLRLTFSDPLKNWDLNSIILRRDSIILTDASIEMLDTINSRMTIRYPWKQGSRYSLTIHDSAFVSIMGMKNDSTAINFSATTEEESASIIINVNLEEPGYYIVQLLDPKENLVEQISITESASIHFKYITPGKYTLKAIDDRNNNGRWDTGNYLLRRYPERVLYFPSELDARANWIIDESWKILKPGK